MDAEASTLEGIQYIVDSNGKRVAVVINLAQWGELWEDFQDVLVSEARKDEPVTDWKELRASK